jgi:hypothetical protein
VSVVKRMALYACGLRSAYLAAEIVKKIDVVPDAVDFVLVLVERWPGPQTQVVVVAARVPRFLQFGGYTVSFARWRGGRGQYKIKAGVR